MAFVACKLIRLKVTSYETGEVTNGREEGRIEKEKREAGGRRGETRDDVRVSRNVAVPPN